MGGGSWLVVGLGNPGRQYAGNRHNVGQLVADELVTRLGTTFRAHRAGASVAQGLLASPEPGLPGLRVTVAKPSGYMNLSGAPVAGLVRFFSLDPLRVLVVHDELDLPFGTLRLKRGGGEGGHNGLRDVSRALGTRDYARLRVGIGRPPGRMDPADYVLRDFSVGERRDLALLLSEAADAVVMVVTSGLERAQLLVHTSP